MAHMPQQPVRDLSHFQFRVDDGKLRELLQEWWPEIVSPQQLKDNGPDQRGFIIGGVRLS